MTQTMREENGTNSFLNKFFHRVFIYKPDLNEMLKNDFFGKQMHVVPFDARL
jgi:hypothetical protein